MDNPSLVKVQIPQIGEGLLEARITARLLRQGDLVTRDEPLLEIETDKATVIIEAPASGPLHEWKVTEGATLPVG
ncbi:MAG: lipoyl domain-containing protein, partial [Armatimonadota bacterium]|nr:lipoyl domain-containing protein [Armatimonadota bacterium]